MAWFRRKPEEGGAPPRRKVAIAEGLWIKCESCKEIVYRAEVERAGRVCPKCRYPFRISARERIGLLIDSGSFEEHHGGLASVDPLGFKDTKRYRDRLKAAKQKTSGEEAVVTGLARVGGYPVALCVFEFAFLGGSMGSVVGEKLTRSIELAIDKHVPVIIVAASRGERPPGAAGRVPALRVPPRARSARRHRRAARAQGHAAPPARLLRRPADAVRMTYAEALARLLALRGGEHAGMRPGLERIEALLDALGHPERVYTIVQIGGTNGKGSVASMLAAMLRAAGRRVGLYTSPHLVSFRERIRVDAEPIGEDALPDGGEALGTLIARLDASVFEATTALA